jgi:hypothetical protein
MALIGLWTRFEKSDALIFHPAERKKECAVASKSSEAATSRTFGTRCSSHGDQVAIGKDFDKKEDELQRILVSF